MTVTPAILAGSSNVALAEGVARALGVALVRRVLERFPDGELHVEVQESVRGREVFIVAPSGPPLPEATVLEVMFLADACRRAGARSVTAALPYFGYARQDRRARGREPIGARVVADAIAGAGVARVIAVDLHSPGLEGFFPVPIEHLTAVPLLARALRDVARAGAVVVSPDLGAVKLAERYARILGAPVAVVEKTRTSGSQVAVRRIAGEVRGRAPIVVDDMISTGGTIAAAVEALREAGALSEATVAATHGLFVGPAAARLAALGLGRLVVSNTLAVETPLAPRVVDVAGLLADAIRRLLGGQSLDDLLIHE